MAHKFPKRFPKAGHVTTAQDVNEGLLPYVEEFGKLNEQNMGEALKTSLNPVTQLADDVAMKFTQGSVIDDQGENIVTANTSVIPPSNTWLAVDDMTVTVDTDGEAVYVLYSCQYCLSSAAIAGDHEAFLQLGIRVDGGVLANSVIGDQDSDYSTGAMETGVTGMFQGLTTDYVVDLAPGSHVFELVARVSGRTDIDISALTDNIGARIHSREYFILEMR